MRAEPHVPKPLSLPSGEIPLVHGEGGEVRRPIGGEAPVGLSEILEQDPGGLPVKDDPVDGHNEHVDLTAEAQNARANERAGREIERPLHLLRRLPEDFAFPLKFRQKREIDDFNINGHLGINAANELPTRDRERAPQCIVTMHNLINAVAKDAHVERTLNSNRH